MGEAPYRWKVICCISWKVIFELFYYKVDILNTTVFSEPGLIKIQGTLEMSWGRKKPPQGLSTAPANGNGWSVHTGATRSLTSPLQAQKLEGRVPSLGASCAQRIWRSVLTTHGLCQIPHSNGVTEIPSFTCLTLRDIWSFIFPLDPTS